MNYKSEISKIAKIIIADSDYVYDPEHKNNPGGGYHRTEKGWSKQDWNGQTEVSPESGSSKKEPLKIDNWDPAVYGGFWGSWNSTPAARHFLEFGDESVVKDEKFYDELFNGKLGIKELLKRVGDSLQGKGEYTEFGYTKKDMIDLGQFALYAANKARKDGIDIDKIVYGKSANPEKKPETFSEEKKMKLVREMPGYWSGLNKLQRNRLSWDDFHTRVMDKSIDLTSEEALSMAAVLKIKQDSALKLAESYKKSDSPFAGRARMMSEREAEKLGGYAEDFNKIANQ